MLNLLLNKVSNVNLLNVNNTITPHTLPEPQEQEHQEWQEHNAPLRCK